MKKPLSLTVFICLVLISCSQRLTEHQAMELIRKAKGYPQLASTTFYDIKPGSAIGQEITRLLKEGYILPQKSYWNGFPVTEKGKSIIGKCMWVTVYKKYELCEFFTLNRDIVRIKKILTDSKKGTATVTYEVGYSLSPYGKKIVSISGKKIEKKGYEATAYIKKYDQGWVVLN